MDFVVRGDDESTHVLNAVSPAWTSSLAVAEHVIQVLTRPALTPVGRSKCPGRLITWQFSWPERGGRCLCTAARTRGITLGQRGSRRSARSPRYQESAGHRLGPDKSDRAFDLHVGRMWADDGSGCRRTAGDASASTRAPGVAACRM
jgi:hypothetical protein